MECQSSDSKKLFKVFDASKHKKNRKKRDGIDESNSVPTDESISQVCQIVERTSMKASIQDVTAEQTPSKETTLLKRGSNHSMTRMHHQSRSPRRHHRSIRDGVSLALKAGMVSTPRSSSPVPRPDNDCGIESTPQEDSFIYAYLEEAIKKDKKKRQRHSRRREERRHLSDEREESSPRDHHRHHRHRDGRRSRSRDVDLDHKRRSSDKLKLRDARSRSTERPRSRDEKRSRDRDREKSPKQANPNSGLDQIMLFETFAKICAQLNEKRMTCHTSTHRTQSHKSLQCEDNPRQSSYEGDCNPMRLQGSSKARENLLSNRRSSESCQISRAKLNDERIRHAKCAPCYYEKDDYTYPSKLENPSRQHIEPAKYHDYPVEVPTRTFIGPYRRPPENRDYRDFEKERLRQCEEERRRYLEHKTSRSFDVNRDPYLDDRYRQTARSDLNNKDSRRYEERDSRDKLELERDRRFESKYYGEKPLEREKSNINNVGYKEKRRRRSLDKYERNSLASRDDDYRERDRFSEKERDSVLSAADGETSTVSARSNCIKVVKQEIAEQREAMDKMMKLWKDLMRCFKGISQTPSEDKTMRESAASVRDSAAAQLQLWRECMRRYETVARDVGDTDARLMEEIKKQRSEMAEMATMWQECLQRYRDISNDFNSLKQQVQLTPPERLPAPPLVCAEGEGPAPAPPYRMPQHYPAHAPHTGNHMMGQVPPGYSSYGGSPLRERASAPPPWMWCEPPSPARRRSSPDSRASRERDRRHRHKERDESRHKEKPKSNPTRSEHKHRKR